LILPPLLAQVCLWPSKSEIVSKENNKVKIQMADLG
jgi:hypothetical protein